MGISTYYNTYTTTSASATTDWNTTTSGSVWMDDHTLYYETEPERKKIIKDNIYDKILEVREELVKAAPKQPHEEAKTGWLKEMFKSKRVVGSGPRGTRMLVIPGGKFRKATHLIGDSDIAAISNAGFQISGVYCHENLKGLQNNTHGLVISLHTVVEVEDNFMKRANRIHEILCMLMPDNRKAVAILWEEEIDEPTLSQLVHFAGGQNIEKLECELPGVVLAASLLE